MRLERLGRIIPYSEVMSVSTLFFNGRLFLTLHKIVINLDVLLDSSMRV